jgi:hypothetical protein
MVLIFLLLPEKQRGAPYSIVRLIQVLIDNEENICGAPTLSSLRLGCG